MLKIVETQKCKKMGYRWIRLQDKELCFSTKHKVYLDISIFLVVDSDSDNFQSLKKTSKAKQNGTSKQTKSDARRGVKEEMKSPVRPSSAQKTAVKSPSVPVTPKSAPPPQPKHTPTSVLDYFGTRTVQRSEKKLVASTKRKAVSTDREFAVLIASFQTFLNVTCSAFSSKPSR